MRFLQIVMAMGMLRMDEAGAGGSGGGGGSAALQFESFSAMVPEGFADKPYMQGVDSVDKLFSKLDGSQKLIGQKTIGIPGADASDDAHSEFFKKLRPEKADDYAFAEVEMPEQIKRSAEMQTKVKNIFHDAGLTSRQAKIVQEKYDGLMKETYESQNANTETEQARLDAEFDAQVNTVFGADKDVKMANATALLEAHAPQSMKDHIASLSNKDLTLLASVLSDVHDKYIGEDKDLGGGSGGGGDDGKTPLQRNQDAISVIRTELATSAVPSMHKNYANLQGRMEDLYKAQEKIKAAG